MGTNIYSFLDGMNGTTIFSQIETSFGLDGPLQMITGGSGQYGCASGYGDLNVTADQVAVTLSICGDLCPVSTIGFM